MSIYDRGSLPPGEDGRLHANTMKVLMCLQLAPTTNAYFASRVCLDYRRRVNQLRRQHGYHIKARRIKGGKGLYEYSLLDTPEAEWEVVIKTIVPDGQFLIYSIIVNAATATEARNNAPRKYVRNEILDVRPVSGATAAPRLPIVNGTAIDEVQLYQENRRLRKALAEVTKRWKQCRDAGKNG